MAEWRRERALANVEKGLPWHDGKLREEDHAHIQLTATLHKVQSLNIRDPEDSSHNGDEWPSQQMGWKLVR